MNRYPNPTPRAVPAIAAAVLTAATLGLAVFLPATADRMSDDTRAALASRAAPAPAEVAIVPAQIDVIGVREPEVASTRDKDLRARAAQAG